MWILPDGIFLKFCGSGSKKNPVFVKEMIEYGHQEVVGSIPIRSDHSWSGMAWQNALLRWRNWIAHLTSISFEFLLIHSLYPFGEGRNHAKITSF